MFKDRNSTSRFTWVDQTLRALPAGLRILDAGAGELRYAASCSHLKYVAQDFGQYDGVGDGSALQTGTWDNSKLDIVSDITAIPRADGAFDVILCSEVFEHIPDPLAALGEFHRLLAPGGKLILTAPFASMVHFAPYFFSTGFSRYWYEHHLAAKGFQIESISENGDWYAVLFQELKRLGMMERQRGSWTWPLAYMLAILGAVYSKIRQPIAAPEFACFGYHVIAVKSP